MNGRCETDPFDRAVDVCRICFGEYCWTCLVEPKGRQQPMCRECALIVGGLRPKAKPRVCGSKKTVKARRAALKESREAPRQHGASFTFFDTNDDGNEFASYDFSEPAAHGPAPDEATAGAAVAEVPPPAEAKDQTNESAAIQRLTTIRRARRQKPGDGQKPPPSSTQTPAAEPAAVQSWTPPMPDGQDPHAGQPMAPSSSAVPAQPVFDASVDPFDTGELDEPAEFRKPRPFVSDQYQAEPAAPDRPEPPQQPEQPGDQNEATAAEQPDADPSEEPEKPARAYLDPDEPVQIHDDPWARTGPEVVSTAPLPKRRPDPKPIEDSSPTPPDWTKAKLPKFG